MEERTNFVERLRELMEEHEVNSKQLSSATGINATSISKWMTMKKLVSLEQLVKLADYFDCSIEFLLGRSENFISYPPQILPPFSTRLREVMRERGLTRYAFVKQTRFKDAHIYQWDKGTTPKLPTLIELAQILDVTIDYLIGREG